MLEETLPELKELHALREELRALQKRAASATDWDAAREGKRLLELQDMLNGKGAKPFPPELGKRQTVAGTVVNGKRQPELTRAEQKQIISANTQGSRGK